MKKWLLIVGVLGIGGACWLALGGKGGSSSGDATLPFYEAKRGDLVIDVLESGNIQALNYLEYRNEVTTGDVKILEIVDEGYYVTEEDVANGKVLVRLDPSSLEERIVDHDVDFQQTEATYAEAKQNIEIEESEALSDIKAARQSLRFALLDFEKFVGARASEEVLRQLGLPFNNETLDKYEQEATKRIAAAFDRSKLAEEEVKEFAGLSFTAEEDDSLAAGVDFSAFLANDRLGDGEAEQSIRRMRDEALVAASQLSVVSESVEGAKRLRERDFITKQTLENELVNLDKAQLALQTKKTELELFQDYEFPKEAQKMLSNYEESLLSLIRTKRSKMAKMSQVYARYKSYKRRYELELKKRQDLEEQLASCVIRAEMPGLVAYGGANDNYYNTRHYESISVGSTLKTGQPIITIPDMSRLGVEISIHESHIKKVELGQLVHITAESVPDVTLAGRISKVAVLPDSNASRYNPSLKVYPATVEIEGSHDFLKPGMTAKAEIIVEELEDIVYVPVQSVFTENDEHFVFAKTRSGYERRPVEIGLHNDDFIEIADGVSEAEDVYLRMPGDYEPDLEEPMADKSPGKIRDKTSTTVKNEDGDSPAMKTSAPRKSDPTADNGTAEKDGEGEA